MRMNLAEGAQPVMMLCSSMCRQVRFFLSTAYATASSTQPVERFAMDKACGATSDPRFHQNQTRLALLSEETVAYQGQAEVIEQEVAARRASRLGQKPGSDAKALQPHLLWL